MMIKERPELLVVDDIPGFLEEMTEILEPAFSVVTCLSPLRAIELAKDDRFDLIITTLVMKELDGFELIRRLRGNGLVLPILMITGYGNANTAVEAMRLGANDYLSKPINVRELRARVKKALRDQPEANQRFLTRDPVTLELLQLVKRVAETSARVLINGETGTGKELIARMLHDAGPRAESPFIAVNCAALPANLIESELFGHEKGAFTGAVSDRPGRFEEAEGGTLFLDEIGELGVSLQSKLLRVLQDGDFQRVGGRKSLKLKARIVAATNRDLQVEVREGRFRQDLFFRLNVVSLNLQPLRRRRDDIRLLTEHFARYFVLREHYPVTFSEAAWQVLQEYDWPGNVRELEHYIERLSILYPERELQAEDLADLKRPLPVPEQESDWGNGLVGYSEALETFQKSYFRNLLESTGYHISRAAALAGMDKGQFHRMIVRLGLHQSAKK